MDRFIGFSQKNDCCDGDARKKYDPGYNRARIEWPNWKGTLTDKEVTKFGYIETLFANYLVLADGLKN